MSFSSLFEVIKVVCLPEPCIFYFFGIPVSMAEAAAVIPNGAKILFVKETPTFVTGPAILLNNTLKNPPDLFFFRYFSFRQFYIS